MNNEVISDKQGIYLIALFIVSETFILARAMEARQDFWLAIIIAIAITIPFMLMFSRLHTLFPTKDLFDINEYIFGKILGKIISFLLIYYVANNMISVTSVFTKFISTASLIKTPIGISLIGLALVCILAVKAGVEVMGRWTEAFFPIIVISLFVGIMLLVPQMKLYNIRPFLSYGIRPIIKGTLSALFFPLTETIVFTMIFTQFRKKTSSLKIYIYGILYGGGFMLIVVLTEVLTLGVNTTMSLYFPGYGVFSRLKVSKFIQSLEILSGTTFVLGGFLKVSVLLLAISRGIAKIFNCRDYRFVVTPTALVITNVSFFYYESTMYMFSWARDVWGYFAFPFQFVIPIIIWITAEIKMKFLATSGPYKN